MSHDDTYSLFRKIIRHRYLGFNVEKFNHLDGKYPLLSLLEIYLGLRKSNLCFEYLHLGVLYAGNLQQIKYFNICWQV